MTPQERAEKIWKTWWPEGNQNRLLTLIAAEIQAAVEEATKTLREESLRLRTEASKGHYTPDREAAYERRYAELWHRLTEAFEEAAKIARVHAEGNTKLCNDPAHDNRYCATCEAMRDEADILEQRIRARAAEVGK